MSVLWVLSVRGWALLGSLVLVACSAARPAPSAGLGSGGSGAGEPAAGGRGAADAMGDADGRRVLRVGTSGDYAPFSVRGAGGELSGFDVEVAGELARELGYELRWVPFRWPELGEKLAAGAFDVAMSGVTWQPGRDVVGYMTRAVARGGPCLLEDPGASATVARRVAVNRGGILEAWARKQLSGRELMTVDDNQSLPRLLGQGRVGAIVTDSFELRAFAREGWLPRCEAPLARKVYWVAPGAEELGRRLDAWLGRHGGRVQAAQERWIGERQRLDANTHLVDLVARRLAYMPLVAGLKAERQLPVEDAAREREVLGEVAAAARREGLPEGPTVELFALQIELSKAVQRRQRERSALALGQIRPALSALGERIVGALAEARREGLLARLAPGDLELLSPWLTTEERERLRLALVRVGAP